MPGWQSELEALLSQLDVSLEPGQLPAQIPPIPAPREADLDGNPVGDDMDTYIPWEIEIHPTEEQPADGDEVRAVSREIEVTVRRVIAMARAGQMESALRDDVVFVLQALTRPGPYDQPGKRRRGASDEARQEWQLASAAAVLRFCRIVLRLTAAISQKPER